MKTPINLSVAIITLNEERNIERCIRSVQPVADEIVVVDSYSTDRTKEICEHLNVTFIEHPFEGYVEQIKYTLTQVTYDYVLTIDADEVVSDQLAAAIQTVKNHWTHDGYTFNRLNNYCGTWIRHSGWYPDRKLRLYDRRKGTWAGLNPHYSFKLQADARAKHLKGDLLHYTYYSVEEHLTQLNKFSSLGAEEYYHRRKKVIPVIHLVIYPCFAFINRYIFRLGFLDGTMGYVVCRSTAQAKYLKYLKLYQLKRYQTLPSTSINDH